MYITQKQKSYLSMLGIAMLCLVMLTGTSAIASAAVTLENGFADVVKKAEPAVVHIRVEKNVKTEGSEQYQDMMKDPFFRRFFGPYMNPNIPQREYKQMALGSGFIISKDGYILTNNHVVKDADKITVILADNSEFKAKVIGTDPLSDVALVKIHDDESLPTLPLGDSDALRVGEWVIAIGNPFGLSQTVTVGVVSATGRSSVGINEYENFIQTDAAINPGNSGGPLLNVKGEVVGINSALYSKTGGYMGIGFAIPINMVKAVESQLKAKGKVTRGWLGVVIQNVDENLAKSFGLKEASGVLISEVQPDSPADKAGVKQGDVIVRLDDVKMANAAQLRNRVAMLSPGSTAKLSIIRNGENKTLEVKIGTRPGNLNQMIIGQNGSSLVKKFGLTFQNLTPALADRFGYEDDQGVLVSEVVPGSPADSAGMQPGQLVEEVNKKPVHNLKDLQQAIASSRDTKRLLLRVRSGNITQYVVLIAE